MCNSGDVERIILPLFFVIEIISIYLPLISKLWFNGWWNIFKSIKKKKKNVMLVSSRDKYFFVHDRNDFVGSCPIKN